MPLNWAEFKKGDRVGIWGAGPAGLLLARAARAMGAQAVNIEPNPRRRVFAEGIEDCTDQHFDLCVVAVGDPRAYRDAMAHMAPRGRLVVFSGLLPDDDKIMLSYNQLHYYEQSLVGAYGCAYRATGFRP